MKNNENKTNKRVAALNYFTSLCFYIAAIINFINGDNKGVAIMFLCLENNNIEYERNLYVEEDHENEQNLTAMYRIK